MYILVFGNGFAIVDRCLKDEEGKEVDNTLKTLLMFEKMKYISKIKSDKKTIAVVRKNKLPKVGAF